MQHRRPAHVLPWVSVGLALLVLLVTPALAVEKWGPFRGQLVDQATGKGIPGAAILAVWWKNEPNPVQMNRSFFDAVEAVTDAEGHFEVPRYPNPPLFSFQIHPAEVIYFAPGYVPTREEITPPDGEAFVARTVVYFRAAETLAELRRRSRAMPSRVPSRKMTHFIGAINRERALLGLDSLPITNSEDEDP